MSTHTDAGYGDRFWRVWHAVLRDRLRGDPARAHARLGFLSPPAGGGRLIWIKSAGTRASVLLGAELVRAIREKRLDVRLALTFEAEYRDLIAPRINGLRKVGVGYGPSARPAALRRVLRRFDPLGTVLVGPVQGDAWRQFAGRQRVAVDEWPAADRAMPTDLIALPTSRAQATAWRGRAQTVLPNAALVSLLVEAQVDPNFKAVVCGGQMLDLWWLHAAQVESQVAAWRASVLARTGVLFVSGGAGAATFSISAWRRTAIPAGSVVAVDDARWLPAIAASASAIHLIDPSPLEFWQALASGNAASYDLNDIDFMVNEPDYPPPRRLTGDELVAAWQAYRDTPLRARREADTLRRLFWAERRRAQTASAALLREIYAW